MNFWDVMSLVGSLALIVLVLLLTYFATRWYARRMGQSASGRYVKIIDRTVISNGTAVVVIQAGEKYYLLGVGDKNVSLLCEMPDFELPQDAPKQSQMPFGQILKGMMDKAKWPSKNKGDGGEE